MNIWRPPRKSGITPQTIKEFEWFYSVLFSPQQFWELTHSSLQTFNYFVLYFTLKIETMIIKYQISRDLPINIGLWGYKTNNF